MVARLFFIHMKTYFLLLTLLCLSLSALAHDAEVDGIFYNLDAANKTATVTFKGDNYWDDDEYSGNVVIPETVTYKGITYSVTSLGDYCFEGCSSLTAITIPNSVTTILYDFIVSLHTFRQLVTHPSLASLYSIIEL